MSFHRPVQSSKMVSFVTVNDDDNVGVGDDDDNDGDVEDKAVFEATDREVEVDWWLD